MARSFYPGDLMVNAGAGTPPAVVLGPGSYFTVWSLKTGGSQYTDLKAEDGVTTLPTSGSPAKPFADGNGNRPSLWGPDAVNGVLWCDTGITRYPMYPSAEVDAMLANGVKKNVANTFTAQQSFTGTATAFTNTPTVSGSLVVHAGNLNNATVSAAFGAASLVVNSQAGTAYTLVAGDAGKLVEMTNASPNTVTVPSGIFSAEQVIRFRQYGAGTTTFAGSGFTIRSNGGLLTSAGQYAQQTLRVRSSSEGILDGQLAGPGLAPAPAIAAGFTTLAFFDEFDDIATVNTGTTASTTKKWSNWIPFEGSVMPGSCFTQGSWTDAAGVTSTSVLTIVQNRWNWNQALYTVDGRNAAGFAKQYGYFEARFCHPAEQIVTANGNTVTNPSSPSKSGLADVPANPLGWPSWWSLAKRHVMYGTELTTSIPTPSATGYLELDFHEYYDSAAQSATYGNILTGTVHDWHGGSDWRNDDGFQYGSHLGNPAAWHTYGCLWTPGLFRWYLDGVAQHQITYSAGAAPSPNNTTVGKVMPSGTFNIADLDTQGQALALGTGNGYPMHVDWVRVWG